MSTDVVLQLYQIAPNRPFFWIDDVFVSGILAKDLNIKHTDLGARVSIEDQHISNWLESSELTIPPMFGRPDSAASQIFDLWNKTERYYQAKLNSSIH